jgi:hypothetical protein
MRHRKADPAKLGRFKNMFVVPYTYSSESVSNVNYFVLTHKRDHITKLITELDFLLVVRIQLKDLTFRNLLNDL